MKCITQMIKLDLELHVKVKLKGFGDAQILVKGTITVAEQGTDVAAVKTDRNNKKIIFKNFVSFTDYVSETNDTQVHNAKDHDVVMPMYNLIEYNNNYSKRSGSLQQYCRDEPDGNVTVAKSFKFKS